MVKMETKMDPNPALNRQALDADADADPDPTGSVYLSGPTTLQKCVAYNFRSSFFYKLRKHSKYSWTNVG